MSKFKMNRRQFMGSGLGTMAYLAAMASPLGMLRKVGAASTTKRYLVNIQGMGGWDTHWFHHTFPKAHANFTGMTTPVLNGNGIVTNEIDNYFHSRYNENKWLMTHPNHSDVYMGMGMKYIFGSNSDLLANDIAIWKGIQINDGHGVGNHIIQAGGVSSYALSFSALIAQGIATYDYQRPLHYIQLTNTPGDFNANWAMNTGAAVPVNLADFSSFNSLTAPNVNDFGTSSLRDMINKSVSTLTDISANRFKLKSTQTAFKAFSNSFSSAAGLGSTNLAQSQRFTYLWRTYTDYMTKMVYGLFSLNQTDDLNPLTTPDGTVIAKVDFTQLSTKGDIDNMINAGYHWDDTCPFSSYAQAAANETNAAPTWITNFKNYAGQGGGWWSYIVANAFNYAMAEFSIREDLAAVIDVPTPTSDAHDNTNDHLVRLTASFSAYKTLLTNLKSDGHLANTTVAMWSELDRTPNWIINTDSYNRGTGHGVTTSVLLAGYGVQGGIVVGDQMTGPGGKYTWTNDPNKGWINNYGLSYTASMPINIKTGQVTSPGDANGQTVATQCVLPTMLGIFGWQPPSQQITSGVAIPALIKST